MDILRLAAAAKHLGISPTTLRRLVDAGEIHAYKYGARERRFDVRDLDAWRQRELQPGKEAAWADDYVDAPPKMTTVYIDLDQNWTFRVAREGDADSTFQGLTPVEVPESTVSGWLAAERFYWNAQKAIKELWPDDPDKATMTGPATPDENARTETPASVRRAAARRIRAMAAFIGDQDMTPAAQMQWVKLADEFERQAGELVEDPASDLENPAVTDLREIARQLNEHLGSTLVAALAGAPDREAAILWELRGFETPDPDHERRLRCAHRLWTQIADAESNDVARSWFIGANPTLDGDTPVTAIREDRHDQAAGAAAAYTAS